MKLPRFISREEALAIFVTYQTTRSLTETSRRHGRSVSACSTAMDREGLRETQSRAARLADELVRNMHADYVGGMSFSQVGRKYGKDRRGVLEIFQRRGLGIRPSKNAGKARVNSGRFAPAPLLTAAEIDEMIATETKLRVPPRLKLEWRKWPMKRRGEFIARLRAKLGSPNDRPTGPFSANVEPFDYTTTRAWEICEALNAGRNSRDARIKLNVCSQGVIYRGELWFWSAKVGYQKGPWDPENGRPLLHREIWAEHHGRPVPPHHVLRFADGNPNNLTADNLILETRNELARENQGAALARKGREATALLLKISQQQDNDHTALTQRIRSIRPGRNPRPGAKGNRKRRNHPQRDGCACGEGG